MSRERVPLKRFIEEYSVRNRDGEDIPVCSITSSRGFCTEYFGKDMAGKDRSRYKIVPRGFFAYNPTRIDIGSVDWLRHEERVMVSPLYKVFSVSEELDRQFLLHFLKSAAGRAHIRHRSAGSVRNSLKVDMLKEMTIPSLTLEEQRRCAEVLDRTRGIMALREEQMAEMDRLAGAAFREKFGDIEANDRGWPAKPLGSLCRIARGRSPRPIGDYLGGTVPWIRIGDASLGDDVYIEGTAAHLTEEGARMSRKVKADSLIFANSGASLGFARMISFDGCIHDGWIALEDTDPALDRRFLLASLNSMTEHFRRIAPEGTQPNLNTSIMKRHMQVVPPAELQKEYVEVGERIRMSRVEAGRSLERMGLLFEALQQRCFA